MVKFPAIPRRLLISSIMGSCLGIGFYIKDRFGGIKYTYQTKLAKNKVVIITGATSGIGKATAKEFAFRKADLVLACRDMKKCEKIRARLIFFSKNIKIKCLECDLASQDSIRKFVDTFNREYRKLDVLVNNAGIMSISRKTTAEGIEIHLGVYMGHFLLTNLLLPKLKDSIPSRIINITNLSYKKGEISKEDLNYVKHYKAKDAYNQSELAKVLFTLELAQKLRDCKVTVNAVNPGVVNTNLLRETSFHNSWLSSIFLKPFLWMFIKNPKQGSQPIIYAAIDSEVNDISGSLIGHNFTKSEIIVPGHVDENIQKWLWNVSVKWTKLN